MIVIEGKNILNDPQLVKEMNTIFNLDIDHDKVLQRIKKEDD